MARAVVDTAQRYACRYLGMMQNFNDGIRTMRKSKILYRNNVDVDVWTLTIVKSRKMNPGRQVLAGGIAEARGGHFFADADDPWGALSLVAAVEWATG